MKAANLLSHADNPNNLYLVDFGLAVKYMKVADSQKALIMLIDNVYILQGRRKCAQGRETGSAEGSRWHYRVLEQVDCCDLSQKYKTVLGMPILVAQRGEVTWRISPLILSTGV